MPKLAVVRNEIDPEPFEVTAQAIADISQAMKAITSTRLSRRAILLLVRDSSGVSMQDVGKVIDSLTELEKTYLKKK